jgi:hypothetical protein
MGESKLASAKIIRVQFPRAVRVHDKRTGSAILGVNENGGPVC